MPQLPMYQGVVNSPQTELAAPIDATQDTIPLLDASVLPPAPNLATLGSGENAETVLYTGVDGNMLIGVTRGFQGTAKAWAAGTKVARLFTAYDWDSARQNIEDHETRIDQNTAAMQQVAGALNAHLNDNVRHVTQADKDKWNAGQLFKMTLDDGRAQPLPEGTDLNTINYSGVFRVGYSVDTNGLPAGTYFVIVYRGYSIPPYAIVQIAINENTRQGLTFIRTQTIQGVWSTWKKVINDETVMSGAGSPEGVVAAPVGTIYLRTDGGTGTTLYVKESGTGNTGWVAK